MTFDEAAGAADQEIELVPDFDGSIEYASPSMKVIVKQLVQLITNLF